MEPTIKRYSHHFIVTGVESRYQRGIEAFARGLVETDSNVDRFGNMQTTKIHTYAVKHHFENGYRFHINHLQALTEFLNAGGLRFDSGPMIDLYEPESANFEVKDGWVPRDDQVPVIEYLSAPGVKKVVDAQTGSGKTIMTMFALAKAKVRCALVIKPMYISRWMDVLVGKDMVFKNFGSKNVMTVRGSAQMGSIINLAKAGELMADFIVISNRTYINYIQHYDINGPSEEYGFCKPEDLWETLGVGIRLIDEAHQDFFGCFLTDLHTHVPKTIELSGSLVPDKPFLKEMYEVMYPKDLRMNTGEYKRYVDVIALLYSLDLDMGIPRTTRRGRSSYSQAAYEEAIIKAPIRCRRLQDMMRSVCENFFMSERLPDHKLLVFFDTVGMCALMADFYQELYPDLYVSKYTEEEDPEVLDEADIIIATPASAGTAVDITNLQQVHSFVMRSSTQALIQMIGRLRKLSTNEVSPKYIYLCTNDIITHQKYQYKIQDVYRYRAKSQEQRSLPNVI